MTSLLQKITSVKGDVKQLFFHRTDDYVTVVYKQKTIGIIAELNNATDLKLHSNYLVDFPLIIYDEFLAIESDYIPQEFSMLNNIYRSINRDYNIPLIKTPKIVLLGNAVNFASPILAGLHLFHTLERHEINTMKKYGNIALEMRRNDHANEEVHLRPFPDEENSSMSTGEFHFNTHNIVDEVTHYQQKLGSKKFYVKLEDMYLKVWYNLKKNTYILGVQQNAPEYKFNALMRDLTNDSTFLSMKYYNERFHLKYANDVFLFDNAFSRDYITSDDRWLNLNIFKLIAIHNAEDTKTKEEYDEEQLQENIEEDMLRRLMLKFEGVA